MSLLSAVFDTPWAITSECLHSIAEIVESHAQLDREQWQGRLEALQKSTGQDLKYSRTGKQRGQVAIIPIDGPIVRRGDFFSRISGMTDTGSLARDVESAANDPDVSSILLEIDSPGGEVAGIEELAAQIRRVDQKKPVVAYIDGIMASAALWIGTAARWIEGGPTAMAGSIGVVSIHRDTRPAQERAGVKTYEIVNSKSPRKRPDVATEEGRSQIQDMVNELADHFIAAVAANRATSAEDVEENFGQGGMLLAKKARKCGMIDAVGHMEPLLARLNRGDYPQRRQPRERKASHPGGFHELAEAIRAAG